jgi:hypothetical protein
MNMTLRIFRSYKNKILKNDLFKRLNTKLADTQTRGPFNNIWQVSSTLHDKS